MLTLGTGVGGGVVIDGMTFRGAHGLGAELGHMTLNPDGPPCPGNCPNRGCLEAYCSGQALERDATELARDKPDSRLAARLGADGKVSGRELVDGGRGGRRRRAPDLRQLRRACSASRIASYVNVFEPERLAIGGGLSRARAPVPRPRRPGGRRPRAAGAAGSASRSRSPRAARTPA